MSELIAAEMAYIRAQEKCDELKVPSSGALRREQILALFEKIIAKSKYEKLKNAPDERGH